MSNQTPFLDVKSFTEAESPFGAPMGEQEALTRNQPSSPFLAIYEYEAEGGLDPQAEEYVAFLNELHDEQFNEALSNLVDEAAGIYEASMANAPQDLRVSSYQAEHLLNQHFAPLVTETEAMFGSLARELGSRNPNTLGEDEVESLVDAYHPSAPLAPNFEEWLGGIGSFLKKVANKGLDLARKGFSAIAKLGLVPILNKLLGLVKPMIKRVIESAIHRLPVNLQPMARMLRDKLPFLQELELGDGAAHETATVSPVSEIQNEFNQQAANLLFAQNEAEMDLEVAHAANPSRSSEAYPIAELDAARERFIDGLSHLKQGEDPTPQVENFLPALIPILKVGLQLGGRQRVVDFLADFLTRLIQRFVGPQYAPQLSKAIVDAGLRLLQLEAPEGESRAAASAVASTVEETVRRVAALPDYVLDNQELLEGAALEAFEQAAAANLPPVLTEDVYRKRPELREHRRGFWHHIGRCYKKRLGPKIMAHIYPHMLAELETFDGSTVGEFLEEQLGLAPGEEVDAQVHLYEAMPGMRLSDIVRGEEVIAKVEGDNGHTVLHPLTRDAAALLLDEPQLGREASGEAGDEASGEAGDETGDPYAPQAGQRFYYLEIPGRRLLTIPALGGHTRVRHRTHTRFIFNFRDNKIVVHLYLSEIRAQDFAVKLRQRAHLGMMTARLQKIVERGVNRAFAGHKARLKIIHGSVIPGQALDALKRLPSLVPQVLRGRLTEWIVKALADHLPRHAEAFIKAAEDTADGVTLVLTLENPPGFQQIGEALKGKGISLTSLKLPEGEPGLKLSIFPGHKRA